LPYLLSANTFGSASQFIWSVQSNLSNPLNAPQDSSIVVTQGGWYFCEASNGFCSALDSVFVAFDIPLNASFTVSDTIGCAPLNILLNNTSTLTSSFLWDFSNGQLDSTTFEPTILYTQPGTYTISLTVTDSICQGSDQYTIQVVVGPALEVNAPADIFLCSSVDTLLIPSVVGAATSIIWSSSAQFQDTLNPNGQANLSLIDPQNTWYYIQISNAYCSAVDSLEITIASDALTLIGPNLVCAQAPFNLQLSGATNAQNIQWSPLASIVGPSNLPSASAAITSSQYIYVEVLTTQSCLLQDSIFVSVSALNSLAVVASANPTIILPNASSQLTGLPAGTFAYSWSPTLGLSNPSIANPQATIEQTTLYTLTVSDGLCSGSDTVLIKVFDSICGAPFVFIPNAFSPNKDGQNDKLYVRGPFIESFVFRVYDRWGELPLLLVLVGAAWRRWG
jgi:PKD repeat protein